MNICADIGCANPLPQVGKRATYSNKRFCSNACRSRTSSFTRLQKKLTNLKLPLYRTCPKCGESFVRESEAQRRCNPKRLTASASCRAEAARVDAEAANGMVSRNEFIDADGERCYRFHCADPMCGKEVIRVVHRGKRQRYCTTDCWARVYKSRTAAAVKGEGK